MRTLSISALSVLTIGLSAGEFVSSAEPGQSITREFQRYSESAAEGFELIVDGEAMDMGDEEIDQSIALEYSIAITDTIKRAENGRATSLVRSFDELQSHRDMSMGAETESSFDESSELEGSQVLFQLEDGDFVAKTPEDSEQINAELLQGLRAEVDYSDFLPEGQVEAGASWELEPQLLKQVLDPCGELHFTPDSEEMFARPGFSEDDLEYSGSIAATFSGEREDGEAAYLEIELDFDVTTYQDLTEMFASMGDGSPEDLPEDMVMPEIEFAAEEVEFSGKGTLLWDREAGRLHSLEVQLDTSSSESLTMLMSMDDMEQEFQQTTHSVGTEEIKVTFNG